MITRQFVKSGDKVSFLWPEPSATGGTTITVKRGVVERVYPNGDFVLVDHKGMDPERFAYAAMGKARRLRIRPGNWNPLHRYPFAEQVSRVAQ